MNWRTYGAVGHTIIHGELRVGVAWFRDEEQCTVAFYDPPFESEPGKPIEGIVLAEGYFAAEGVFKH
jgi:hypothetical protein